ncbi:putative quinol monooxygenase [Methanococcus voltae]|uniref:Quinol monooxygenase YgiN n=2 Tax=Methanococcus voltae TaxID=2188 RepID=A0A8J7RHE2_METVO|nr:antibiotic biosynthesis monooxygenase family protein [Methanococcus voltae]MBP2173052.1 quinol monooxygenase YgiN [Methanococcus voltae]MBP2201892.1 quinol monooxygenase YgiN [Methanococcus voltae]MCS3922057.1 quinol monooxygenase YgiN [Methanococcus voltae PS]
MINPVKIIAKHYIKKENLDDYIDGCVEARKKAEKGDGYISVRYFQDVMDEHIIVMSAEWENMDKLEKYVASKEYREISDSLSKYYSKKAEVNFYREI